MQKTVVIILGGIILGLVSFIFIRFDGSYKSDASFMKSPDAAVSKALADIQKRLSVFEEKMTDVIDRNTELEILINDLDKDNLNKAKIKPATGLPGVEKTQGLTKVVLGGESEKEKMPDIEEKISRFTEAGLSEDDARWIVEKQDEWQLDSLYSQWESRRKDFLEQSSTRKSSVDEIKERLGPEGYERYLKSIGSDTSVVIGGVIEGAPADLAGLKPDDEIISYNGERVYNYSELQDATVHGELGESVTVELIRDGKKMQISMDRGPLGVNLKMKGGVYYTSTLPALSH